MTGWPHRIGVEMEPVELAWCRGIFEPPTRRPEYDVDLDHWIRNHGALRCKAFYQSPRWRELRARVLAETHGASVYELALSPARYSPAECVHHVMRVEDAPGWALSEWAVDGSGRVVRNLIPLSHAGHNVAHGREELAIPAPPVTVERW